MGLNFTTHPGPFTSCIAGPGQARPVDFWTRPGRTYLLPAHGFTILRLAHIPTTPPSCVTIDN